MEVRWRTKGHHDPSLTKALERFIKQETRSDPVSPLRWICKHTRNLFSELTRRMHPIRHIRAAEFLHKQNDSLQEIERVKRERVILTGMHSSGISTRRIKASMKIAVPVITVDTKKKELIGNYHK